MPRLPMALREAAAALALLCVLASTADAQENPTVVIQKLENAKTLVTTPVSTVHPVELKASKAREAKREIRFIGCTLVFSPEGAARHPCRRISTESIKLIPASGMSLLP